MVDGIVSFGLLNLILGILMFFAMAVFSVYTASPTSRLAPGLAVDGLAIMLAIFLPCLS